MLLTYISDKRSQLYELKRMNKLSIIYIIQFRKV